MKTYTTPELSEWGTVTDLTQVGFTNPGNDCLGGSVNPDGHSEDCPT